jgi:hypothetical protein
MRKKPMQQPEKHRTNSKPIPHIPLAVQGGDSGRAQGEAAGETAKEPPLRRIKIKPDKETKPEELPE